MRVRGFLTCLSGGAALLIAGTAYAGSVSGGPVGSVDHSPLGISQVPTLGGWLLIILALLMGLVAYNRFRQQSRQGMPLAVAVLAAGGLAMAGGGVTLVASVDAQEGEMPPTVSVSMTNPQGGRVDLPDTGLYPIGFDQDQGEGGGEILQFGGQFELTNVTGVAQTISRIGSTGPFDCTAFAEAYSDDEIGVTLCRQGDVLAPDEQCSIACFTGDLPIIPD